MLFRVNRPLRKIQISDSENLEISLGTLNYSTKKQTHKGPHHVFSGQTVQYI